MSRHAHDGRTIAGRASAEDRFWRCVRKTKSCWIWTGAALNSGYGRFFGGRKTTAHRYSFELHFGKILSQDIDVCHTCDVRLCVNPSHLFLGSRLDNMSDARTKGFDRRGEQNTMAILTEDLVRDIRVRVRHGETQVSLARELGVHKNTIYDVVHKRRWAHI